MSRVIAIMLCLLISLPQCFAQVLPYMSAPNQLITRSEKFNVPYLTGMEFNGKSPFDFTFILNRGDMKLDKWVARAEVERLNRYFLAALAIPAKELWVNLSPYENNRISTEALAMTDLGKDMLGEDYMLKQLASSLTYPESVDGKKYWDMLYKKIFDALRTTKVTVNSFHKIWIVPGEVKLVESERSVAIEQATLKVMMEKDYLASEHGRWQQANVTGAQNEMDEICAKTMRETILPLIEKEVNEGRHFSRLRQLYRAIIMANWFKRKLKNTIISKAYFGKNKLSSIEIQDKSIRGKIYQEYVEAFNKGVYNYIRKETNAGFIGRITKRHYFSGGEDFSTVDDGAQISAGSVEHVARVNSDQGGDVRANVVMEGKSGFNSAAIPLESQTNNQPATTGGLDFAAAEQTTARLEGGGIEFEYKDAVKFLSSPDFAGLLLRTTDISF